MINGLNQIDIKSKDRVVFIHIPKTAGITFRTILGSKVFGLQLFPEIILEKLLALPIKEIKKYQFFMGHFPYWHLDYVFPEGFIGLTFLREPVSRTISHFQYLKTQNTMGTLPQLDEELVQIKKMNLDEFVNRKDFILNFIAIDIQTRYVGMSSPRLPFGLHLIKKLKDMFQEKILNFHFGVIEVKNQRTVTPVHLRVAIRRLKKMAFFGLAEKFQESLNLLCFTFGWRPIMDDLQLNSSPKAPQTLRAETLSAINYMTSLDSDLYKFGKTLFKKRYQAMIRFLIKHYGSREEKNSKTDFQQDAISLWLEKHYEVRREKRNHSFSPKNEYFYVPTMPVEGAFGWYPVDNLEEDGPASWSGPGTESGFDLPRPQGKYLEISFRVLLALSPEIIDGLILSVDGYPVYFEYTQDTKWAYIFKSQIQNYAPDLSFVRLLFKVPKTIKPNTVNSENQDPRSLGILLNWVKIQQKEEFILLPHSDIPGWYPIQDAGTHGSARWSGPNLESGFEIIRPPGNIFEISFRVLLALSPEVIQGLTLCVNDKAIPLEYSLDEYEALIFRGQTQSIASEERTLRLLFIVPRTIRPSAIDPESQDERSLGILLNWIKIIPKEI